MRINKKKITALGLCLATIGFFARKDRRDELRYWIEYQTNRLGMIKKASKDI